MKTFVFALLISTAAFAQEHNCAMHGMNSRGDKAMGFSQEKTTHHFVLQKDGGAIDVAANDAADTTSRDQIRAHLQHVSRAFADGDFALPMFIHDKMPPGAKEMKKRKANIAYRYEETSNGARVVITTSDAKALRAVHDFLKFQIEEHATGDPTTLN